MLCDYEDEFGQISWRFVSHSYRIFYKLQSRFDGDICASLSNSEKKLELQEFSKSFREILLDKLAGDFKFVINSLEKSGLPKEKVDELDRFLDKIYSVEQFWHLCEFYLLGSSDSLLSEVISWLKVLMTEYNVEQHVIHFLALVQDEQGQGGNVDPGGVLNDNGFWEAAFGLSLHGQLGDVWTLLSVHPDIQALHTLATSNPDRVTVGGNVVATAKRLHGELHAIFNTFPFNTCGIVRCGSEEQEPGQAEEENSAYKTKRTYQAMGVWRERVQRLRDELITNGDPAGALSLLPGSGKELVDDLLGILVGDMNTLKGHCESWVELSLCLVLFVYNTPANALTFNSFSLLVDEAMGVLKGQEMGNLSEQKSRAMIRQVLRADVGAVVHYILSASGDAPVLTGGGGIGEPGGRFQVTSVLGLLCATHLSCLFHLHGNILGLPQGQKSDSNGSLDNGSFLTRLVLELSEKLAADDYPAELLMGYLSICPEEQARPFLVTFLSQRGMSAASSSTTSDAAVAEITTLLRSPSVRAFEEARLVERSRGTWWYKVRGNRVKAVQYYVRGAHTAGVMHITAECMRQCTALVLGGFGDASVGLQLSLPTAQTAEAGADADLRLSSLVGAEAREELQRVLAEVQEVVLCLQIDDVPSVLEQTRAYGQYLLNHAVGLREYSLAVYGLLHLFCGDGQENEVAPHEFSLMYADTVTTFYQLLHLQVLPEQ